MMLETLEKLISFKTVSKNHAENKKAMEWVKDELKDLPLHFQDINEGGFPALVATTQKTKKPKVWLQAHMDVVEGSDRVWNTRREDGRLYGRGAYDMKFAIACYMEVLKSIGKKLKDLDLALVLTSDEEVGGEHGTKAILDMGYGGEVSILPDGGYDWKIEEAAKGSLMLYVKSRGVASHGARPWDGNNALNNMMQFLSMLQEEFPAEDECCDDDDHHHNTMVVAKLVSGTASNKVPHKAEAWLDIRYLPHIHADQIREVIEKHRSKFDRMFVEEIKDISSVEIDQDHHYINSYRDSIDKHSDTPSSFCLSHGASDARFLAEHGIIPIVTAPRGGGHHSEYEWIDIEDLSRFYEVIRDFVEKEAKM
ncbi:MAG: M20/M25/M40 family metallo-hydrolase [Candidatus Spechtbacterales bacterium]|nr:M20/M25/M40 family metallo-hydrolase [Candidatus Spechtbacterales bacterium]